MNTVPPIQPAPTRAASLDAAGRPTKIWVQWFQQLLTTSQVVATNTTSITGIGADLATINTTLATQAAEIVAAAILAASLDVARDWSREIEESRAWLASLNVPSDYTHELDELRARHASLDGPRDYTREIDELRARHAAIDGPRDWSREIDELRSWLASLDGPQWTNLAAMFDALGAAAAAVAAIPTASASLTGLLSAANWATFNAKQAALTPASLTEATSSVLTITGAAAALLAAVTIQVKQASASQAGYLASADWAAFNAKQAALTLPLAIAQGGIGAASFLAAGLPALSAANVFTAANSFAAALTLTAPASVSFGTSGSNWQAWTPASFTPGGSMTMTAPTSVTGRYLRIGPLIHFRLQFTTTFGGTLSNQVNIPLPVAEFLGQGVACAGQAYQGSGSVYVWCGGLVNGATLYVNSPTNFTAGSYSFYISGTYQCAG